MAHRSKQLTLAQHYAQRRRLSIHSLERGLFTLFGSFFPIGDEGRPNTRILPLTISIDLKQTAELVNGLLFEFSDAFSGIAAYFRGDQLGFVAGSIGTELRLTANHTLVSEPEAPGKTYRFVFSVIPLSGEMRMWFDGKLIAQGRSFPAMNSGWAPIGINQLTGDGEIGGAHGAVTGLVPGGQAVDITGARVLDALFMVNQRPQSFNSIGPGSTFVQDFT